MTFVLSLKSGGSKTSTREELDSTLVYLESGDNYFKSIDGIKFYRIGLGKLLISQIQGNYPNQRLDEQFNVTFDIAMQFHLRFTRKNTSDFFDISGALEAEGFLGLAPVTNLDNIYMLVYESVVAKSRFSSVDNSEAQIVLKQNRNFVRNIAQNFADYSNHDQFLYKVTRQDVTKN